MWKHLALTPDAGGPGEPLEICGVYAPDRGVRILVHRPTTNWMWLPAPEVVVVGADGRWCWVGVFATHIEETMDQETFPIEPGWYQVHVSNSRTFQEIAVASIQVLAS